MQCNKPKLRGRFHQVAFYLTLTETLMYIITWIYKKGNLGISIYLLSQLLLFGISSTYHITNWKNPKIEYFFQLLDHISIFILISGTQTSVVLNLLPKTTYTKLILFVSWSITIAGVSKILLLRRFDHALDTVVYLLHGVSVVPFFKILVENLQISDVILFIVGGIIYFAGGLIYGLQKPDPYPCVFGYHEVFHVFTVIANYCFSVPIFKSYLGLLRAPRL